MLVGGNQIVDVVGESEPRSDINIWRERQEKLSDAQLFFWDKADVAENAISAPHKKTKNKDLTTEPKTENPQLAQKRIVVEHIIRLRKFFLVAAERFRLNSESYEQMILTLCGLVRWLIGAIVLLS